MSRFPLHILFGLPDDGRCRVNVGAHGKLGLTLPGTASIVPYLDPQRFDMHVLYLQPGRKPRLPQGPGPLVNHVADPDLCGRALKMATGIADQMHRPCFNPPRAVAQTTRDGVARALQGIPGLTVPRTIRIPAGTPAEVRAAVDAAGLRYPLLVRVAGFHAGMNMLRIDAPDDMNRISGFRSGDLPLYAVEFHDFVSEDGRYRKYRIAVVGNDIFMRHMIVSKKWLLHAERRGENTEAEEADVLRRFDSALKPRLLPLFRRIADRLGMDYFGVDCSIKQTGVLLFEANACMNIMEQRKASPNMWEEPVARIRAALQARLLAPHTWRASTAANAEAVA